MKLIVICIVLAVQLLLIPDEASAECCTHSCQQGSCNIFGCNCNGGCRRMCHGKREAPPTARDVIRSADLDGDSRLSLREALVYLTDAGVTAERAQRSAFDLDLNNDHFLSAAEIDPLE